MGCIVAAATNRTADEADPEVGVGVADGAFVEASLAAFVGRMTVGSVVEEGKKGVCVSAYGAAGAFPFLETGAVEYVLAKNSEEASGFIHSL